MKLQAIKQVCSRRKAIVLVNTEDGEQWIGDGSSLYPVDGIRLSKANLFTVLDIDAKQAEKYRVQEMDSDDPCITTASLMNDEDLLKRVGPAFYRGGDLMQGMMGRHGILFINTAYTKPAARKDEEFEFYLRMTDTGHPVVAVYADMLAGAIIWPYEEYVMNDVREDMEKVTKGIGMSWRKEGATAINTGVQIKTFEEGGNDV